MWRCGAAPALVLAGAMLFAGLAAAAETVRIGVLKYGTVNWELAAMAADGLDIANGIQVEMVPFAGEDATAVALQAGEVDVIVSDWLWVSRLRGEGADLTFVPWSTAVGALMVPPDSPIADLAALRGKRIGVAGGPLDKNWLLIQGLARKDHRLDLAAENEIVYGAPPLLAAKAEQGELDAVLNFWHVCARLEAKGFRRLIGGEEAARRLADVGPVAALGWVFRDEWASAHPAAVRGLIRASAATKERLRTADAEWERLSSDGVIPDAGAAVAALRDRYREGIPTRPAREEEADAATLYRVLAELGGEALVGKSPTLFPGTWWSGLSDGS